MTVSPRGHTTTVITNSSKKYVFKREQKTGSDGADVNATEGCSRSVQRRLEKLGRRTLMRVVYGEWTVHNVF